MSKKISTKVFRQSEVFLDGFTDALLDPTLEKVRVWGFGDFIKRRLKPRKMRLVINGPEKIIDVQERVSLRFKPSQLVRRRLNSN